MRGTQGHLPHRDLAMEEMPRRRLVGHQPSYQGANKTKCSLPCSLYLPASNSLCVPSICLSVPVVISTVQAGFCHSPCWKPARAPLDKKPHLLSLASQPCHNLAHLSFRPASVTSLSASHAGWLAIVQINKPCVHQMSVPLPRHSIYLKCPSSTLRLENSYSSLKAQLHWALLCETCSEPSRQSPAHPSLPITL